MLMRTAAFLMNQNQILNNERRALASELRLFFYPYGYLCDIIKHILTFKGEER